MKAALVVALLLISTPAFMRAAHAQDVQAGEDIFDGMCHGCHLHAKNKNYLAPSLCGVVGRHSASVPGFNYSDANRKSGITWTENVLFKYLKNPHLVVPNTKMSFDGLPDEKMRRDVIAYLKTLHD